MPHFVKSLVLPSAVSCTHLCPTHFTCNVCHRLLSFSIHFCVLKCQSWRIWTWSYWSSYTLHQKQRISFFSFLLLFPPFSVKMNRDVSLMTEKCSFRWVLESSEHFTKYPDHQCWHGTYMMTAGQSSRVRWQCNVGLYCGRYTSLVPLVQCLVPLIQCLA